MPDTLTTSAAPSRPALSPQTRLLLEGPILSTLLRLAWPNILVMVVQSGLGVVEAYYVSWLGTDAIAGIALVLPMLMFMQMMSGGAMGGGIASAIARALGGGRRDDADALAIQAIYLALFFGLLFSALVIGFGPSLYGAFGGRDAALAEALAYSNMLFAGNVFLWLANTFAAILRGTGSMMMQAVVICGGAVLVLVLAPVMLLGFGPIPAYGIAGAAAAVVIYYAISTAILGWYVLSGRGLLRPGLRHLAVRWSLLADILHVGSLATLNTILTNLTVAIITALLGVLGTAAIAGYGIGVRLEYMLIPLTFGLGGPLVAMVGTNIGAGKIERAQRAAWIGAAIGFVSTETLGLAAALFPEVWLGLFTSDPDVIAIGTTYLQWVGPSFGGFGLGMVLYFSSQGAGRMLWPFTAGVIRMVFVAGIGWLLFHQLGYGEQSLFITIAVGLWLFGGINAASVAAGAWRVGR
jgi:putative MATE family efflux protein